MNVDIHRVFAEKRAVIVPLLVVLAANVGVYALAVYPLGIKVRGTSARAAAADRELVAAQREHALAAATQTGKQRAGEELTRFYAEVLPPDLAGARRITYLRLAQLARQVNLRSERRSSTPETERASRLGKLRIMMVLEGEYENVRRFIYQLETAPEFVVIEGISLTEGAESAAPLVLTLELSTYFRNAEHGE